MKIDKVRIVGFKSFADPTQFEIGPGITAIVGPNGCGKSNLIEALRWGMGETSAKRVRADGMDDVIFGGTEARQPRASCEVGILIDNSSRLAPAEFNAADTLDVVRRLDRGDGSSYRVNAKTARARDVQVLFQDAGAGASSASIVSQGKVGAIINAKPSDRRSILEEAAGVAGLSTRRHEAEIRLRATEQNLERADEMERGLQEQLATLRRQARQAARRRSIDELIRAAEAMAFLVRWKAMASRTEATSAAHAANEGVVAEVMLALKSAEAAVADVELRAAPALRERSEAETAYALARARIEQAEREIVATRNALASARRGVERAQADLDRERATISEREEEIADLSDRKAMAEDDLEHDAAAVDEAAAVAFRLEEEVTRLISEVEGLASEAAAHEVALRSAETRRSRAATRVADLEKRAADLDRKMAADRARLEAIGPETPDVSQAEERVSLMDAAVSAALEARLAAAAEVDSAARLFTEAGAELTALRAEMRGLRATSSGATNVSEHVRVQDDMEAAFAAALGEGFSADVGIGKARWWVPSLARVDVPQGATPLSSFVTVPVELEAAVAAIGVVDDDEAGEVISARLEPGQAIVSRTGRLWRWDGYRSSGVGNAAEEVRRAARLRNLLEAEPKVSGAEAEARSGLDAARRAFEEARRIETSRVEEARKTRAALDELRRRREREDRERREFASSIEISGGILGSIVRELETARGEFEEAVAALTGMPPMEQAARRLSSARQTMEEARNRHLSARNELDRLRRECAARRTAIEGLSRSMDEARRRRTVAEGLCVEMSARAAEAAEEERRAAAAADQAPGALAHLREELEVAASAHAEATRKSAASEAELADARRAVSGVSERLAVLREERARLLAELKAAREAADELRREIGERLSCLPDDLPREAGVDVASPLPALEACEARLARLVRERDGIGTVNPLAEEQATEMDAKLGEAQKARSELKEAVSRLRRTILDFDREARARLTDAFALIDGHFKDLFGRLFGGGHAHLRLSGSEDILEAGLEIYACPPGKRLQTMSLLSGGEQALAALALVFAAFLVKPAPVCVLDEVDAPLDDANVNRLCSLVADMARDDATRFLVVTHHALTMARADRLYGVTMAERGVSRLTTLDMEAAAAFVGR